MTAYHSMQMMPQHALDSARRLSASPDPRIQGLVKTFSGVSFESMSNAAKRYMDPARLDPSICKTRLNT